MNLGILSVRATKEANAGGPWVQPHIVQVLFQPTYIETLLGLPTKESLMRSLTRSAESLWGKRENLQLFMGAGKLREGISPEELAEFDEQEPLQYKFPATAVFVELEGPLLEPNDPKHMDLSSNAWLVMLGGNEIFGGGINRAVQRLVDGYEVVWSDVAINTAP